MGTTWTRMRRLTRWPTSPVDAQQTGTGNCAAGHLLYACRKWPAGLGASQVVYSFVEPRCVFVRVCVCLCVFSSRSYMHLSSRAACLCVSVCVCVCSRVGPLCVCAVLTAPLRRVPHNFDRLDCWEK